jgi:hypothetical protein
LLLIELIMASGIDRALSTALALWRKPLALRDSGKSCWIWRSCSCWVGTAWPM